MKLAFLIQLILLLLLVVSLYMVFTNSVGGRMRLIMIVFCVVIGIYLFQKLKIFNDYDEFYSTPTSARTTGAQTIMINKEELKKSEGHFSVSMWIFIDDWNYNYGATKNILKKVDVNGLALPHIYLDAYKNDLHIDVDMFAKDSDDYQTLLATAAGVSFTAPFVCKLNNDDPPVRKIHETSTNSNTGIDCPEPDVSQNMIIENINMQKWVNIITTVNNRTMDVYINGKLIKTKTFDNIIDPVLLNSGGIELVSGGGFGGFFSKVQYYPYFITPEKAWSIYKGGFGDAFESALDRYNMSLSFYKDSVEQNKMYLF